MLDEIVTQQNASKFVTFLEYEIVAQNEKNYDVGFRIPKIWQILKHNWLGHFIKQKPLISEEWHSSVIVFNTDY